MGLAAEPFGRRSGFGLIVCIAYLVGSLAQADNSGWDRFLAKFGAKKTSNDTQTHFPESEQLPDINHVLEETFQPDEVESILRYYASQSSRQRASLTGGYSEQGHLAPRTFHGSYQFGSSLSSSDANMAANFETDVVSDGPRWAYVRADKVELSALAGSYWVSQTNGIDTIIGNKQTVLAAADTLVPMVGMSLGWNLTTNLQFTLNGDYLSVYYEDSDGSIINLWAGLRYNLLDSVGIGIGYDMLEVDVESADLSFSGLIDDDRQWGPKAFLSLRF